MSHSIIRKRVSSTVYGNQKAQRRNGRGNIRPLARGELPQILKKIQCYQEFSKNRQDAGTRRHHKNQKVGRKTVDKGQDDAHED
jgi:hypothetical protein